MSSFVPLVPNSQRSGAGFRSIATGAEPTFPTTVRWILRVLAWLAFGTASYLAWHALTETSVAGCTMGAHVNCDAVLSSSWSKFLSVPVAFLGLACYATLAALSVLLGLQNATANRWISTAFITLSMIAAGASIWFIGVQLVAIGSVCLYCLITDISGIALGIIATVFGVRAVLAQRGIPQPRALQPGLMALRAGLPPSTRTSTPIAAQPASSKPWLLPAVGIAVPVIAFLIGGQILFPYQTFGLAKGGLNDSIAMDGSKGNGKTDDASTPTNHVMMRIPPSTDDDKSSSTGPAKDNSETASNSKENVADASKDAGKSASDKSASAAQANTSPAEPAKRRLLKVLDGKLTLDVYQHPVIGSPDAPHIAIEMASYDCNHCRKTAPRMQHALDRYGDQVALLVMLIPMESECNKLLTDPSASKPGACQTVKLALGISRLNQAGFAPFHEFVMSTKDKPPEIGKIISKAYTLTDRTQLRELTQKDEVAKQIEKYVDLYGRLQKQYADNPKFGLPVQILGDYVMTGEVEKEEDIFKAWEEHLGVKPQ